MRTGLVRLAFQLLRNGIHFRILKWTGKSGRPQAVSLEITHRCVAKCMMCNIWRLPSDVPDLPMDEWIHLLGAELLNDLREVDITGGEPFLREDLVDLVSAVSLLKEEKLKRLRTIAITTNGLMTEKVLEYTEKMLQALRGKGIDLVMACALDGIGEIHDRIRNYKNAWSKVDETIKGLTNLRKQNPYLLVGLKTTILPVNVGQLDRILQYADENGLFSIISPCIITDGRYLNKDRAEALSFNPDDVAAMARFYRSKKFRWSFHAEKLVHYLEKGVMKKPCSCGFNYFFVRSTGEVLLCPLINQSVGNLKAGSIEEIFRSPEASRMRRGIGGYPSCRTCTEPGLERYALPYEGFTYLFTMIRMGGKNFRQLHAHMGLDKYLGK
jgi:MoaA/NifB/PqqE/SkfB family radical SAM enzyme